MIDSARPTIACVGQTNVDHVFTIENEVTPGEKHAALTMSTTCGGGGANQAITIARLGGHAMLMSRLGADAGASMALGELRRHGVDVSLVEQIRSAQTSTSAVIIDPAGERTIANHADPAIYFGRPPDLPPVDAVVTDGRWGSATMSAIRHAREIRVPAVVDVDERVPHERVDAINRLATHVIYSERGLLEHSPDADVFDALRHAQRRTDAFVAVTCGERGVLWLDRGDLRHRVVLDVDVVDSTGAGDAFHAAFALALAKHHPVDEAIDVATVTAACTCTAPGVADGAPTWEHVEEIRSGDRAMAGVGAVE